ncbi:MAG: GDP-mannose 4,6-dehydratase [Thaumarchaeota archaeon]|nr:GDP-mannose 4,6-dehydratase [Nitrososphaerota archaeon]
MRDISTAIVTGGAGFIGSHIVDELLKKNIETFVLDNFSTGTMENLAQNQNNKLLHIRSGDIENISELFSDIKGVDAIFHEAAIASVPKSVAEPVFVHNVNVNSTLKVLNFCVKEKVKRLVFASSSAVYGLIRSPPAVESLP